MSIYLGIDIGAVSIKAALVVPQDQADAIQAQAPGNKGNNRDHADTPNQGNPGDHGDKRPAVPPLSLRRIDGGGTDSASDGPAVLVANYRRTRGRPLEALRQILASLTAIVPPEQIQAVAFTGSGSALLTQQTGAFRCNEFQAITRAVSKLQPQMRTVFEIGGESSKYLRLEPDPASGELGIKDYSTNGDCAAGTGSFLDQQAGRLKYAVEEIGDIVAEAQRTAQIAGRCSVFAKSDMIHAQQKGFGPTEVLKGLCKAVAVNYKSAVVRGRAPEAPVLLIGGVSANTAVVSEMRETFALSDTELQVPETAESYGAIGAALAAADQPEAADVSMATILDAVQASQQKEGYAFSRSAPLTLDNVQLLRDRARTYDFANKGELIDAYLGIDIGSVGTKLALVDADGEVIHYIFTRTEGRPIEVVTRILRELEDAVGARVCIRGVGTTGSGRELIGELVGADSINDEITCHKTGATFVGDRLLGRRPDTIFEIGGQDSKYISLESEGGDSNDTIVVDFTMNEACAAGTGSFLEERAEELGVAIKGEFAAEALRSNAPIKLGERCTVFMERDVNTCMQRGAKREDVIAGLAYSVVYNYINRVVRGRPIGDCIFFQGGTAYNDAVAAAFSMVTGKEVIVPPHNAILGAIGAALLAKEKTEHSDSLTRFRGYDMTQVEYSLREFTCKGCGNYCAVQEFKVEGEKTFWGDKCSDRYRKHAKSQRKATIPDLVARRKELLAADDHGDPADATTTIGIPMAMYSWDLLPLWRRFWRDCGFKVVVSDETNRQTVRMGYDCVVAEPCFPIIVAHGHVAQLTERNVDYVWLPNVMSAETPFTDNESHVCPWGQTLPFVLRQAPAFRAWQGQILCPTIRFRDGEKGIRKALVDAAGKLGVRRKRAAQAFDAGLTALQQFRSAYRTAGDEALAQLRESGDKGIIIVGRPYNIHDPGVSLSTAKKLRDLYGVNVIPIDALPVTEIDIRDVNENMFWEYGRRILAASKLVSLYPNLHMIYITNFKCGPDSFVKGFVRPASGKPFLTLQFDGHSNDAGMMTRCEAYLDSKGILRWWREHSEEQTKPASKAEPSTSPKWLTPEHDSWPPDSGRSGSTPSPLRTPTPKP